MSPQDNSDDPRPRFRVDGPPGAPVCVLGPSLGTSLELWDPQVPELARDWQVVRYDLRGHGGSPAPRGPYAVADLAADVLSIVDELDIDRFAYCGLSLGGAVGTWLAVHRPERLSSLVLCCTAAQFGEPATWRDRAARVRDHGVEWLAAPSIERWFTSGFAAHAPNEVDRVLTMLRETNPEGYASCCDALADFDLRHRLHEIDVPTRVIAGEQDPATPPDRARELADGTRAADLVVIRDAAHLASVEQPATVTAAIAEHFQRTSPLGRR